MNALAEKIRAMIETDGPISLGLFMHICLHDKQYGYYATRPGLGQDFITSPEISQIFGELLGLWCAHEWESLGCPEPCFWIELGPGRGVLAADALRAMRKAPAFFAAMQPILVETSPILRQEQKRRLDTCRWESSLEQIEAGSCLLIANEFLDCLPLRHYLRSGDGTWCEQMIGIGDDGELCFGLVPTAEQQKHDGDAWSGSPALEGIIAALAERLICHPGRALFIDYGSGEAGGIRAFANGRQVSPLAAPGEADITANVDFRTVRKLATTYGLDIAGPVPQGSFLTALGAKTRAQALAAANPQTEAEIYQSLYRLLDPDDMGRRFEVICLSSPGLAPPCGFAAYGGQA